MASKWKMVGEHMEVPSETLSEIENTSCREMTRQTLQVWVDTNNTATIDQLIGVVRSPDIGDESVAQEIASDSKIIKKYGVAGNTATPTHK